MEGIYHNTDVANTGDVKPSTVWVRGMQIIASVPISNCAPYTGAVHGLSTTTTEFLMSKPRSSYIRKESEELRELMLVLHKL